MFKTKSDKLIDVEAISWDDMRNDLTTLNPELVAIIDSIAIRKKPLFYKASYCFGNPIIEDSIAYLSLSSGGKISFNDPELPKALVNDLSYDTNTSCPLGIILDKNCELYMSVGNRIVPHMLMSPGKMFGIGRTLNNIINNKSTSTKPMQTTPSTLWDMSAGARSIFMLPKISDSSGLNKLNKHLHSYIEKPLSYQEHHQVFEQIAKHSNSDWRCVVVYFSNEWLRNLEKPEYVELVNYLFQANRAANKIWHNTPKWTAILNNIDCNENLDHYSYYVLGTARHLLSIAAGAAPGFKPAINDASLPAELIRDIYINAYELNEHWPIMMEITEFSCNDKDPVYYSLNYPTLAQYNPTTYKGKSIITLESDVKQVMETYCDAIINDERIKAEAPSLYNAAATADFTFYHNNLGNSYSGIKSVELLLEEDPRLECKHAKNATFPTYSAFFKGCVKIQPK